MNPLSCSSSALICWLAVSLSRPRLAPWVPNTRAPHESSPPSLFVFDRRREWTCTAGFPEQSVEIVATRRRPLWPFVPNAFSVKSGCLADVPKELFCAVLVIKSEELAFDQVSGQYLGGGRDGEGGRNSVARFLDLFGGFMMDMG